MTKIAIYGSPYEGHFEDHPAEYRPIGLCQDKWERTDDLDEADWIYFYTDYLACNEQCLKLRTDPVWNKYAEKGIFYAMHDKPRSLYLIGEGIKFVAQPICYSTHSIVPVPLQMRHFELELIKDTEFIEEVRNIPKIYDTCFIGQTGYENRAVFRPCYNTAKNYLFEETKPIWGITNLQDRVEVTKEFLRRIASAKTCYAPRGVGSSSFRLFQSLMVGTIPIISGMIQKPFPDLDWNSFSIETPKPCIMDVSGYDLETMREKAIDVWEKFFRMENTDIKLFERYLAK